MSRMSRTGGIDRSELLDLDGIHEAVQGILRHLDSQLPGVRAHSGRNTGGSWLLFTYRTFEPAAGSAIDPVVVGVTLSHGNQGVVVRGDIAGELSGDVLFQVPAHELSAGEGVREAVEAMARRLSLEASGIRDALTDAHRRID